MEPEAQARRACPAPVKGNAGDMLRDQSFGDHKQPQAATRNNMVVITGLFVRSQGEAVEAEKRFMPPSGLMSIERRITSSSYILHNS